jgi:hypothetical protein
MKKILPSVFVAILTSSIGIDSTNAGEEGRYREVGLDVTRVAGSAGTASTLGLNLEWGYKISQSLSIEGGLFKTLTPPISDNYDILSLSMSVVGHLPVHNDLGIYVKAGVNETSLRSTTDNGRGRGAGGLYGLGIVGAGGHYGVGIELYLDEQRDSSFRAGLEHFDITSGEETFSINSVNLTITRKY